MRRKGDIRSRLGFAANGRPESKRNFLGIPGRLALLALAVVSVAGAAWWLASSPSELDDWATGRSYWASPLPDDAPVDPRSDAFIKWLKDDNNPDHVMLAGVSPTGRWGLPVYESTERDPTYSVENTCSFYQPPEFKSVRIPRGARPDDSADGEMSVYDLSKGIVYGFFRASYSEPDDEWGSCGGTAYYLDSNGLDGSLPESDEPRNFGHRGLPPYVYAVRYDEIRQGAINHVLKIAVNTANEKHVFPMTGSDGNSSDPLAPPEGARIRLKPHIDLSRMDLTAAERVIASALQRYGAVIGDQSGGGIILKVENTVAEGSGDLWRGLLTEHSLDDISIEDFEVIELGYMP